MCIRDRFIIQNPCTQTGSQARSLAYSYAVLPANRWGFDSKIVANHSTGEDDTPIRENDRYEDVAIYEIEAESVRFHPTQITTYVPRQVPKTTKQRKKKPMIAPAIQSEYKGFE